MQNKKGLNPCIFVSLFTIPSSHRRFEHSGHRIVALLLNHQENDNLLSPRMLREYLYPCLGRYLEHLRKSYKNFSIEDWIAWLGVLR